MSSYWVVFLPSGNKVQVQEGASLWSAAYLAGEEIETICGGKGTCGKCKVRVIEGTERGIESSMSHLSPLSEAERTYAGRDKLDFDERLSCQARVTGDVAVWVLEESRVIRFASQKAAGEREIELNPAVRKYYLEIEAGTTIEQYVAELESRFGLADLTVDPQVQSDLQTVLDGGGEGITLTVWNEKEIIRAEVGRHEAAYGLALDIGTTTVAGYLCDLETGEILFTEAVLNPQIRFGEDIMSRIAYARDHPDGLGEMNRTIISAVNEMVRSITARVGLSPDDIAEMVMVGNTVMHHIFLGLDIVPLGMWPFPPVVDHSVNRKARELGLEILASANVHTLPIEAAYVGADNVGVMLAEEPYNRDEVQLIIDVGTNGELILGNRERVLSASCATGPAFEGGNIRFGMRAAPGAIDRVRVDPCTYEVSFSLIGKRGWSAEMKAQEIQARGICGSGIIDAVAEMLDAGIIRNDGGFDKSLVSPRLRAGADGKPEFVIAWSGETAIGRDIVIVQKDIRSIQLAMAAISTGARLMLRRLGIEKPDKVVLAGAFGSFIDPRRALKLGMFPDCGPDGISSVGNAAGDGARIALLNKDKRAEADRIAREAEYIELTGEPGFNEAFIQATHFPS
ncbi:MAG: ASKHA domain-containing protein [Dehalococcoidia bacterium]